jgi:hypothetical protein
VTEEESQNGMVCVSGETATTKRRGDRERAVVGSSVCVPPGSGPLLSVSPTRLRRGAPKSGRAGRCGRLREGVAWEYTDLSLAGGAAGSVVPWHGLPRGHGARDGTFGVDHCLASASSLSSMTGGPGSGLANRVRWGKEGTR